MKIKLFLLSILLFTFTSCSYLVKPIAGNFHDDPSKMKSSVSKETLALIDKSFEGLDPKCVADVHVHAIGVKKENGNWISPKMTAFLEFKERFKYHVYMSASGIKTVENADEEYIERLVALHKSEPRLGKIFLLAFDMHYDEKGKIVEDLSSFKISNDYVLKIAKQYPDIFEPVISVHPARKDAISEINRLGKLGARYVKWLPNAMRIDPSSKSYLPYYNAVKKFNMVIMSHTGEEKAVHGEEYQTLGNPLRLRYPLSLGVKFIAAHASSRGICKDFDNNGEDAECFDLLWRMMNEKQYEGKLYSDISVLTMHERMSKPIDTVLTHPKLQKRMMNGSDYPLPAINILFKTGKLVDMGYLTEKEKIAINEVYKYNPLLFDFMLKRFVKHPKTRQGFINEAFELPKEFGCY